MWRTTGRRIAKRRVPAGRTTGYVTPPGASAIDERKLDHSTIWRMLGWLGGQVAALLVARRLIQEQQPSSTCHRFVGAVAPHKFAQSETRAAPAPLAPTASSDRRVGGAVSRTVLPPFRHKIWLWLTYLGTPNLVLGPWYGVKLDGS